MQRWLANKYSPERKMPVESVDYLFFDFQQVVHAALTKIKKLIGTAFLNT